MTKKKFSVAVLFLVMCVMFLFVACNNEEKKSANYDVTLSSSSITLDRYETATLTAVVTENEVETDFEVTWASDNTNVVAVDGGVLTAKGVGTAKVTATYKSAKAECAVTVEDTGMRPILVLSEDEVEIVIGGSALTVDAYVSYKNQTVSDAEISYKIGDTTIAEVDATGKVTAKSYGTTDLTVSAKWHDADPTYLTQTIPVSVKENVLFEVESTKNEVYIYNGTVDEVDFWNTAQMSCTATIGGEPIAAGEITWKSSDDAILTVDGSGVVTGVKAGEAYVTANYDSGRQVYSSVPFKITVLFPVVDKTDKISIDLDTSLDTLTLDASDVFGEGTDKTIVNVADAADEQESIFAEGKFIKDKMTIGERQFIVYNDEWAYKISAVVATKILRTEQDLKDMQTLGGVKEVELDCGSAGKLKFYPYSGYFILGNNIEATVSVDKDHMYGAKNNNHDGSASTSQEKMGFTGVFDGRGYTISNFCFTVGGLFGDISDGAVIKNVAFTNIQLEGSRGATIANSIRHAQLINIFLEVSNSQTNAGWGQSVIARYASSLTVKNLISVGELDTKFGQPALLVGNPLDPVNVENVYAFYKDGCASSVSLDAKASERMGVTAKALADANSVDFAEFGEYFTNYDSGMPLMKTIPLISVTELTLDNGSSYDITKYLMTQYYTVEVGELPTGVTYEDGVFTVGVEAEEASFTFKVKSTLNAAFFVEVTVDINVLPIEFVTVDDHFEVDLSEKKALTVDLPAEHGFTDGAIVKIGDKDVSASASVEGDKLSIAHDALVAGNSQVVVTTVSKKITYTDVEIITKILRTEQDLKDMQTLGGVKKVEKEVNGVKITYYPYSGYFVLGNNIEATVSVDAEHAYGALNNGHNGYRSANQDGMGFTGVFDGRGYTISGFCFTTGGLLGDISTGAVVKNLALTNVKLNGGQAAPLAFSFRNAQISNLFVEVSNEQSADGWANSGILRYAENLNMSNVVVISALKSDFGEYAAVVGNPLTKATVSNVYSFHKDGTGSRVACNDNAVKNIDVTSVALSAASGVEFADLGEYFTTSENGIPVMKTMPVAAAEVTMTKGTTYNVSDCVKTGYYTVEATELPSVVTYSDGVFTLTGEATGTFTFKVISSINSGAAQTVTVTIA